MRIARFTVILMLLGSIIGCSGIKVVTKTVSESGSWDFVRLVQFNDKHGQPQKLGFAHPQTITEEQMYDFLSSVRFTENSFFKWRYEKDLFIKDEKNKLVRPLVKAFSQANENQIISFAVTAKKKEWFLPQRRINTGYMFFEGGEFHLVMGNMNLELLEDQPPEGGDPRTKYMVGPYRLEPKEFQKAPGKVKKHPYWSENHNNWLITDWNAFQEAAAQKHKEEQAKKELEPKRSVTERLQELRDMLKDGLITKDEFEQKKKELLNEL